MRVFAFSNLLPEFPIQILNNDGHFENYATARTLILSLGRLCRNQGHGWIRKKIPFFRSIDSHLTV